METAPEKVPEFCLVGIDHWSTCMTKAEWSGWTQAVGAIAAILVGAMAVRWQVRRQAREARIAAINDELALVKSTISVIREVKRKIDPAVASLSGPFVFYFSKISYRTDNFDHLPTVLGETNLTSLNRPELSLALLQVRQAVSWVKTVLDEASLMKPTKWNERTN
jgi:hypothetical protein